MEVGGTDCVTKTPLGVAVQEDKQIDQARHDREPGPAGLTGNEPLPEVEDAAKPENLAGYKDQKQGEEDQVETDELVGTCDQECDTSKDQQQNDRTPVSDDTPKGSEEEARRLRLT